MLKRESWSLAPRQRFVPYTRLHIRDPIVMSTRLRQLPLRPGGGRHKRRLCIDA